MKASAVARAYLAGILDGEGCFYISRKWRNKPTHRSAEYQAKLYVVSTDKALIDWIHERFDGLVYTRIRDNPRWKIQYTWCAHAATAMKIVRMVRRYLVIKEKHAAALLKFEDTVEHGHRGKQLPPAIIRVRESCYQEIKHLNARNRPT